MVRRLLISLAICPLLFAQKDGIQTKSTYNQMYGKTKGGAEIDPSKDLPRYPAVEPKDASATWQVKKGFKLELAAHEPQVRDPIAICFDERGRMFVCEMIDYSEMRDVTPHLGRISMLEDKDGDGYYETSQVFADDLPWPTGLIWANGGLFVGATPDIWRFEDKDGDGRAEVREKVFTGFGTGLKILNVQGLMNSFQWGQDNKIHILAGGGNRGVIRRVGVPPDLQNGLELGGKDFWFDPLTLEFGLEGGGAQYGMSFDNYGRKFGCSNSDHLQYWVYDDKYANRNPYYQMPPARQSIAVDGGAAEVFRISPDEPWRIIRTRWRIAGVVKGAVEGGGRVSGYFTGATGTTIYRGDAYGAEFVNNSFSGDAGGQLVHRKIIKPSPDGISLIGERPADERGFEFAASKDTWVRVVNFANAPDGCLHICDMYREVIEHPWSIPDEIKKHIDLNSGNDRGRIYRIVPEGWRRAEGEERRGNIAKASTEELVKMLGHPNGWHRDTAQRMLYERKDKAAVPLLEKVLGGDNALAKLHALGALEGLRALTETHVLVSLKDTDAVVREHAIKFAEVIKSHDPLALSFAVVDAVNNQPSRVALQAAFSLPAVIRPYGNSFGRDNPLHDLVRAIGGDRANTQLLKALGTVYPDQMKWVIPALYDGESFPSSLRDHKAALLAAAIAGAANEQDQRTYVSDATNTGYDPDTLGAIANGLKKSGSSLKKIQFDVVMEGAFQRMRDTAIDEKLDASTRISSIRSLEFADPKIMLSACEICLGQKQPDSVQTAAIHVLAPNSSAVATAALLANWPHYGPKAQAAALDALLARDDRAVALLEANLVKPAAFSAAQVQALIQHKSPKVAAAAKLALASVIPPSREEVAAKFRPAIAAKGDATKGMNHYISRCMACHRAGTMGLQVGPDLVTVKTKGREALLTAVLEPHKEVAPQFIAYTVNTKDGQTLSGVITNDTATSMTLKMMGGVEKTLQRMEIKGSTSTGQSLMPEGLETGMSLEDMADLLSFIEGL